ncbi:hypothetical protein [Thioalkalivibrio sp. ALMg11]|uniref:hypothetical protein n=1 Tax=Thioalkalivibrio sp. ALMg11 TaxID=1158165 RepID=UPI0012DFA289|nr:hypothetical protein [Thioalkalivibrio sp. ALMg11]
MDSELYRYSIPRPDGSHKVPSPAEIDEIATTLGLKDTVAGRYSSLLVAQLFHWGIRDLGRPVGLVEEIAALDQGRPGIMGFKSPDNAQSESTFRGPLLEGLKHHHFLDPETFQYLLERAMHRGVPPNEVPRFFRAERERNRLTGDWLIYTEHGVTRYYLALGRHGHDAFIHNAIVAHCGDEFPFLRALAFWPE